MNLPAKTPAEAVDAVIVGAGFAGLYGLIKMRRLGLSVRAFEVGDDVGGTWYWNRYPGARCDVESVDYSYSFSEELQQEWVWSERYASQPEILRYLNHVADRFELRGLIRFGTRVTRLELDESSCSWQVRTDSAESVAARFVILATGSLSAALIPDIPGLETFGGTTYHTGHWPHGGVDFQDKRVAVIGTGSSGIQSIPRIAQEARQLVVFQRTPNFSVPVLNPPLDAASLQAVKSCYAERRLVSRASSAGYPSQTRPEKALEVGEEERRRAYEEGWRRGGVRFARIFADQLTDEKANETAADFVRAKIRQIVRDPEVAKMLTPTDHPIGAKRICTDTQYFETFNRDNVELVDVRRAPIREITSRAIRTSDQEFAVDSIVFATGFDAMTGSLLRMQIRGREGTCLQQAWAAGPRTYLGLSVAGFPNAFIVTGPGSPSVLTNMVLGAEQHIDWIADCIDYVRNSGAAGIEADASAQDRWVEHVNDAASQTLLPKGNSWYLGANVDGKPRVFMPYVAGLGAYAQVCRDVAGDDYRGFHLVRIRQS